DPAPPAPATFVARDEWLRLDSPPGIAPRSAGPPPTDRRRQTTRPRIPSSFRRGVRPRWGQHRPARVGSSRCDWSHRPHRLPLHPPPPTPEPHGGEEVLQGQRLRYRHHFPRRVVHLLR